MRLSGITWPLVVTATLVLAACSHVRPSRPGSSSAAQDAGSVESASPSTQSSAPTAPSGSSTEGGQPGPKSARSGSGAPQSHTGAGSAGTNTTAPRSNTSTPGAPAPGKRGATPTGPGGAKSGAAAASGAGSSARSTGTAATGGAGTSEHPAPAAGNTRPAAASLDLNALEDRLRSTHAIGVFTKLSLKNQVDDLLGQFRAFHARKQPPLSELRQRYDLLLMKVLSLLQDGDPPLAAEISSSREALWNLLTDPQKFAKL